MTILRPVGSMGVEYLKEGDPTKIHGVVLDTGESMWRAECMCCGVLLALKDEPSKARASARSHMTGVAHRSRLASVKRGWERQL